MGVIFSLPYIKVERSIENNQQYYTELEQWINLYPDQVVTTGDKFSIDNVTDISYRILSGENCFLYLHTNRGVFMYRLKSDPESFIMAFREVKRSRPKV